MIVHAELRCVPHNVNFCRDCMGAQERRFLSQFSNAQLSKLLVKSGNTIRRSLTISFLLAIWNFAIMDFVLWQGYNWLALINGVVGILLFISALYSWMNLRLTVIRHFVRTLQALAELYGATQESNSGGDVSGT